MSFCFGASIMRETTFTELRNNAKSFFDKVEAGETVRVYRNGKPVADIVPVAKEVPAWKREPRASVARTGLSLSREILKDREKSRA
jgi:prevent-host-death family protein